MSIEIADEETLFAFARAIRAEEMGYDLDDQDEDELSEILSSTVTTADSFADFGPSWRERELVKEGSLPNGLRWKLFHGVQVAKGSQRKTVAVADLGHARLVYTH